MKSVRKYAQAAVTAALFVWLGLQVDWSVFLGTLQETHLWLYAIALTIFLARNVISALRWQILLNKPTITVWQLTQIYMIGNFYGFFLPTAVGGDVARAFYVYRLDVRATDSASSVLVERVLGIAAMLLFALISVALVPNVALRGLVSFSAVVGLGMIILFFRLQIRLPARGLLQRLNKMIDAIQQYPAHQIGKAFLYSAAYQFIGVINVFLIGRSLGDQTAFLYYVMLLPIVWVVTLLPISLNGLGIREGAFVFLFVSIGMLHETAVAISLLNLLTMVIQAAIGGLFSFRYRPDEIQRHAHSIQ